MRRRLNVARGLKLTHWAVMAELCEAATRLWDELHPDVVWSRFHEEDQ